MQALLAVGFTAVITPRKYWFCTTCEMAGLSARGSGTWGVAGDMF